MITDVLRPISTRLTGGGVATPSGTLHGVTSDNSDSTYIQFANQALGNNWNLRVGPHTPTAGYQRHRIQGRIRARTDAGTANEDIDLGRGSESYITYATAVVGATFAEYSTGWFSNASFGLATVGALSDLNVGGGWFRGPTGGATELRTAECYVDIDCRYQPDFIPQVQDNAGVDHSGGTITDTNQPDLFFGTVAYDGLPALSWDVAITSGATTFFSASGNGTPPSTVPTTVGLPDGAYIATFKVRSTIREADPFERVVIKTFGVQNTVPPPSPPNLTVVQEGDGYRVSWTDPGGQPWDFGYVVAEVWRTDCYSSQRIASIPSGLNGSYLDLAIPQLDPRPALPDCDPVTVPCDITYQVRYWGHISSYIVLPTNIPADMILGWPGTVGTIPSGWSRVTALDGYFPMGAPGTGAPTATGGSTNHTHTGPAHTHNIQPHLHLVGGSVTASNVSTDSGRYNGATYAQANQPHTHTRPAQTGTAGNHTSGSTAAAISGALFPTPPYFEVIWIKSTGSQTSYPVGALAWSAESVSGWETYAPGSGRFLRGAAAAGNGGGTGGSTFHLHSALDHTHLGALHSHNIGDTGLSTPVGTQEAQAGSSSPRWLPRHSHPMRVNGALHGTLQPPQGPVLTSSESVDPPNRRLQIIRNTNGGTQTRVIGLYTGTVAALNPLLTLCNGSNGALDMRNFFARDPGSDAIGSTGGSATHTHTMIDHTHVKLAHVHDTTVEVSENTAYLAPTTNLGDSPTQTHVHTSGDTAGGNPDTDPGGAGITSANAALPVYKEAHFVRLDGAISGSPLPVPELRITDFSSATVPAFTYDDDLDRLATKEKRISVVTDRSSAFPKLAVDSTPLGGGLHTVASTTAGEDLSLTISAVGLPAIDELEDLLSADRVYWAPLGGEAGWFAPGGWSVAAPTKDVKVLQVTLVRQDWPAVDSPELSL